MGYRIQYVVQKRKNWYWALLPVLAALIGIISQDGWYEAFARYVGAAILGH